VKYTRLTEVQLIISSMNLVQA